MKILTVGDVTGECGVTHIKKHLRRIIKELEIDFTVINGENSLTGNGISKEICDIFFNNDCDCITLGNHTFKYRNVEKAFDFYPKTLIRPLNYDPSLDGEGYTMLEKNGVYIGVINLMGRIYLENLNCPFLAADKAVERLKEQGCQIIMVDFHAEATSEKKAMGYYLDGRVSAVFGTHTHTQTCDEQIFEGGTGFITDIGMTGSGDSILGLKKEISINKIVHHKASRFLWEETNPVLYGCVFDVDENTGKCRKITRIKVASQGELLKSEWE